MKDYRDWDNVVSENNDTRIKAQVTGREIEFDKSIFPTSISVHGQEILYAPIRLTAEFGDIVGEWKKQRVILTEKTNEYVRYSIAQNAENLIVNADVTIEFDGMIKVDLNLIPFWGPHWISKNNNDNIPRLTKLYIDIPMKNEYSGLMHFWPNCESGVSLSGRVINSHATPEGETNFAFKPYLWTGWEYGGLGIFCESDKGFEVKNPDKCMTITRNEEYTNMHISLLDDTPADWKGRADVWGNNINPITYTFGIQPTPVKEFNKNNLEDFRAFHTGIYAYPIFEKPEGNGDTMIEKIAASGANWLILHEDWTLIQNYGLPEKEERFKEFVTWCHAYGLKVMVYFGYEISSLYPGFGEKRDEYLNKNINGNYVGGWQREPIQRDFTVCYKGGYSDVMIERVEHVMDNYGVDGIYTDGTYVPWECANEAHGCGYRDREGNLKFKYPIFATRDHVKKLYKAVHKRGGIVDTHQSSCCLMATLAFVDGYYDGENIQGLIQEDIKNLKMDSFRAEFMGENMGIYCNFISYTGGKFTMENIAGITLLHNVYPRAGKINDLEFMEKIWKIYDEFNPKSAKWCPYWEEQEVKLEASEAYMSYYKKDGELLLIITSYDENATEVSVMLDGEYKQAVNALEKTQLKLEENKLAVPVKYSEVTLIRVK